MRAYEDKSILFLNAWRMLAPGNPEPVAEFRFAPPRRFRWDWAFREPKLAIEVDGGQWISNGGRHARDTDREKCNLGAMLGWRVFHYSPQMLTKDPTGCVEQVVRALGG